MEISGISLEVYEILRILVIEICDDCFLFYE